MISTYTERWKSHDTMNCCPCFWTINMFSSKGEGNHMLLFWPVGIQTQICNPVPIKIQAFIAIFYEKDFSISVEFVTQLANPVSSPSHSPANSTELLQHPFSIPLPLDIYVGSYLQRKQSLSYLIFTTLSFWNTSL